MSRTLANRYVLGELIGAGGMSDIYMAEDRRLSRKVAIKLLRSDLARDPQFISRFKKEEDGDMIGCKKALIADRLEGYARL